MSGEGRTTFVIDDGLELIRPTRLNPGDRIATVSLSSGLASGVPDRYAAGKRQIEDAFGLQVVEAPNSQRDDDFLHQNPQARADDLVWALTEPEIKGIISNIGGSDSVRILPLFDHNLIRRNPKIFMGFSDTTIQHAAFLNAGVVSFYGPSVLTDLAENRGIHPYTADSVRRLLFSPEPFGEIVPAPDWTEHFLEWSDPKNQETRRAFLPNPGWRWIQGPDNGAVEGRLVGGCMEVLEMLKGTEWWPSPRTWEGAVLYFETSELAPELWQVEDWLRNYASQGILTRAAGMLFGRPHKYTLERKLGLFEVIRKVLAETGRSDMPVAAEMDFGHTSPAGVLPNGCRVRIDAGSRTVALVESAVS